MPFIAKYLITGLSLICLIHIVDGQKNVRRTAHISKESFESLYIETYFHDIKLGSATGFIIKPKEKYYLVTNYHVVSNKDPQTKKYESKSVPISPDKIRIKYKKYNPPGDTVIIWENLLDKKGKPVWFADSVDHNISDVAEIPLTNIDKSLITTVNYNQLLNDSIILRATDKIVIVGYPFGLWDEVGFPIWQTGFIATEPEVDADVTIVDASAFPGMSGSPVYFTPSSPLIGGSPSPVFIGLFSEVTWFTNSNFPFSFIYDEFWKVSFLKPIFDKLP